MSNITWILTSFIFEFFTKVLLQQSNLILNPSLVNWQKLVNLILNPSFFQLILLLDNTIFETLQKSLFLDNMGRKKKKLLTHKTPKTTQKSSKKNIWYCDIYMIIFKIFIFLENIIKWFFIFLFLIFIYQNHQKHTKKT
jgi:hypothetical protein